MKSGIYKITNKLNGKFYIGQSVQLKKRWYKHKCPSASQARMPIARAIAKYGHKNFIFEAIEICHVDSLNERERFYIRTLKPHYNVTEGGDGSRGHVVSENTKTILSAKAKEQWQKKTDDEKLQTINRCLIGPRVGHPVSSETREKLRESAKKQYLRNGPSAIQRQKASETMLRLHRENKAMMNKYKNKPVAMVEAQSGIIVCAFESVKEAAVFAGVHTTSIIGVCKAKPKYKTAGGFKWIYAPSSVETIPSGSRVEMSTTRSAEQPIIRVDDIVRAMTMAKSWALDRGMMDLVRRSREIVGVPKARLVYENDLFDLKFTDEGDKFEHTPHYLRKDGNFPDPGQLLMGYLYVQYKGGGSDIFPMSLAEINKHRKRSKAADSGPWVTDFEAMAKKTLVRANFSYLPMSIDDQELVAERDGAVARLDLGKLEQGTIDVEFSEVKDEEPVESAAAPVPPEPEAETAEGDVYDPTTGEVLGGDASSAGAE